MAKIRPFCGLRYDPNRVSDFGSVMAPPYDVVDAERRAELAARSDVGAIHFILPDGDGDERYARGEAAFRASVQDAMVRDPSPGYYVYHQRFEALGAQYTRKGFVALVELTRFGDGPVLPHERTLAGPKLDRLKLMRACDAHLELVFGMFPDPDRGWERAIQGAQGEPVLDAEFDGVQHTLWRVSDAKATQALTDHIDGRNIYIADGHHRFETMVAFREELEARGHPNAAFGMIYLSNLDDPGLVVLPTHRIVHSLAVCDLPTVLDTVAPWFTAQTHPLPADPGALRELLGEAGRERAAFGLTTAASGELHVLTLRPDFDPGSAGLGDLAQALQRLDVVLLHELVLERALGIDKPAQEAKTNLRYFKSTEGALAQARGEGDAQLVCLMNATPVADVRAVCDSGEVMPQKSTFFFPKIPNGLVFYDLRPEGG